MNGITSDEKMVELINVITVKPEYQQHIVDNVRGFLKRIAKEKPGFISARIYKSQDRSRVAYFIRWRNPDDGSAWFEITREALKLTKGEIENADYHLYEVIENISL